MTSRRNSSTSSSSQSKAMSTTNTESEFDDLSVKPAATAPNTSSTVLPTIDSLDVATLRQKIDTMKDEMKNLTNFTNYYRRYYYAESELIIMDIEIVLKRKQEYNFNEKEIALQELLEECLLISKQLKLQYSNKEFSKKTSVIGYLIHKIDEIIRGVAIFLFFIFSGVCLTLPCVIFCVRSIDSWLVSKGYLSPFYQLSNLIKTFIAHMILRLGGIDAVVENLNYDHFGKDCAIVCFSHSSTIDAFVISLAIPVRHYTLAKKELFLIPFFAWQLLAYGAIPIDRSNRDQAVQAIASAAESAGSGDCVCIAPEGTRSTTGQILPFKKGAFYMWDSLRTPMIPLLIYGAYDLLPPSSLMAIPGKVYGRFLPPTYAHQAQSREEMSYLVRKQMLVAWRDGPKDAGGPLSWSSRLITEAYVVAVYAATYGSYQYLPWSRYLAYYGLSKTMAVIYFLLFCIGITLVFYVYLMYLKRFLRYLWRGKKHSSKKTNSETTNGRTENQEDK